MGERTMGVSGALSHLQIDLFTLTNTVLSVPTIVGFELVLILVSVGLGLGGLLALNGLGLPLPLMAALDIVLAGCATMVVVHRVKLGEMRCIGEFRTEGGWWRGEQGSSKPKQGTDGGDEAVYQ